MGFHATFVAWIGERITTALFSILINGQPHGSFQGPIAPYLFVLLWKDMPFSKSRLYSTQDLSTIGVEEVMEMFAEVSGLHTNPKKSELFLSKVVPHRPRRWVQQWELIFHPSWFIILETDGAFKAHYLR
ncbi:hypothetical protein Salat_0597100 [Sesamum alatum]|uniref:Reverse transcriptase domain-containing protein n=1 Tax=Sesamum alatum TaxID=300844 RepID=A0AAE2CTX7_9LAMI|nr:hypothetical protein Salat_0597100 [Sesamum alatum]